MMSANNKVNDKMPATAWLRDSELAKTPSATKKSPETAMNKYPPISGPKSRKRMSPAKR